MTAKTLTVVLIAGLFCIRSESSDVSKFVQANGDLGMRVVVQDAQSGVVGRAGTEIVIERDGTWTKSQFWGEQKRKELGRGKLSRDEIKSLTGTLARHNANQFPREFGKTDPTTNPNPHYIKLEVGNERCELALPPKTDMSEFVKSARGNEQVLAQRFDAVVAEVKKLAGESK